MVPLNRLAATAAVCVFALAIPKAVLGQHELLGHWQLRNDAKDLSSHRHDGNAKNVTFGTNTSADSGPDRYSTFDGQSSEIMVPSFNADLLADGPFSIAAWVRVPDALDDVPGDVLNLFDPATRTGLNLGIYSHTGVTNSQPNDRQLHFGFDAGQNEFDFQDHGQLGNAVFVFSLCVHNGKLYASTCHSGENEAGRVFRFEGGDRWTDLGSPDKANSVSAMISWNGQLYVGSAKYRLGGSSLAESQNPNLGGAVYRLNENDTWERCGRLSSETEAISSFCAFGDHLYAASLYKPAGFFRFDGREQWTPCALPDGKRIEATTIFNGQLFASCYDEGSVFRFDGDKWHPAGKIPNATQTYGFAIHRGELFVSEWPQAHVYRYQGGTSWDDAGKLGDELEAMPLVVYNGKLYGGTLPSAEIYRYDDLKAWTRIAQVDATPNVKYRRAWSMAVFQGRLFVGTLPSGRVHSFEAGRNVTFDHRFPSGWHHVAAIRDNDRLRLYIDTKLVAESKIMDGARFNLAGKSPLRIGFGAQDHFHGDLADLRIYKGALSEAELKAISSEAKPAR